MTRWIYAMLAHLRALFFKSRLDAELNDELSTHIEFLTEEKISRGMDRETARREALLRVGNLDAARASSRCPWNTVAIGAQARDVLRMLAAQNMVMVVAGLSMGVAGSFVVTRMIATMLYGVEPADAPSFFAAVALIVAFALAATLLPSWRASRLAPSRILRHE